MSQTPPVTTLIVDDDPGMSAFLAEVMSGRGHRVFTSQDGRHAIDLARQVRPDLLISDVRMVPLSGIDVLRALKAELPETIFILMTAFGTLESAIDAVREGAYDYVSKPFKTEELLLVVDRALESRRIANENLALKSVLDTPERVPEIVGRSPAMIEVFKSIAHAAASSGAVLIQGETGTGKELVARAIHNHSPRGKRPYLAVNCAALPESLLESELFGHEKGSFTGATTRKAGIFREADGGTVLLDEIGEMPAVLQTKLLRTLQSGEVRPVGSAETVQVDVRVFASSNRNLRAAVAEGTFREDLFFRLNTLVIRVPPLREHLEDLSLLVDHFLRRAQARTGRTVSGISEEALKLLRACDWPGNVRELEHVIDRAVAFARHEVIVPEDLPADLIEPKTSSLMSLEDLEKRHILYVLRTTHGSRQRTAEILGIDRKTLYRKLLKYGLEGAEELPEE